MAAVAAGCGQSKLHRTQDQQYQVVQEGTTSGASSTIDGPQEVRPPVATNTSADTTTDFTLPSTTAPANLSPNTSLGATLPKTNGSMTAQPLPAAPPPANAMRTPAETVTTPMTSATPPSRETHHERTARSGRTDTSGTSVEGPPVSSQPRSDTATTAPPAVTDTSAATDTSSTGSSDQDKKAKGSKDKSSPPPPSNDSSAPPPPPPSVTGTVGPTS